jgi:DNA-directed RNA polymerase I subunit RPA1
LVSDSEPHGKELDDEEEEDGADDYAEDYERRIELYVKVALYQASGSKRDHYKDSLVYQARKDAIAAFNRTTLLKKCSNCGG